MKGKTKKGTPRKSWKDDWQDDLNKITIRNWRARAQRLERIEADLI